MSSEQVKKGEQAASAMTPSAVGPLVSVVIPTYNRAALLERALESVRQQTYTNLDIIIVDDASTEDIHHLVDSIEDPRIRYIRHDVNRGGAAARNTGIRAASGEFVGFLDDDDAWEPDKTKEQLKILRNYEVVLCASTQPGKRVSKRESKKTVDLEDLRQGKFTGGGTGLLMAKASVLKETMFDESLPCYQDWDLFIRIAQKQKIAYLDKVFVRYNQDDHVRITNSGRSASPAEVEQRLRMLQKHRQFFGGKWFKRHMCRALLYGIKDRRDRFTLLVYTARRYGLMNVAGILARRVRARLRKSFSSAASDNPNGSRRAQP